MRSAGASHKRIDTNLSQPDKHFFIFVCPFSATKGFWHDFCIALLISNDGRKGKGMERSHWWPILLALHSSYYSCCCCYCCGWYWYRKLGQLEFGRNGIRAQYEQCCAAINCGQRTPHGFRINDNTITRYFFSVRKLKIGVAEICNFHFFFFFPFSLVVVEATEETLNFQPNAVRWK